MSQFVIVRAYADKPVRLSVLESKPEYVLVAGADPAKTIGFPPDLVYQFDATLFERLRDAYERKDADGLKRLWLTASRYESGI
jgi:hypothetical protein